MSEGMVAVISGVVGALASAVTVGIAVKAVFTKYTQRVFDVDVLDALGRERARYKEFHEGVFASEFDRGRRTADIASGVQHDLRALTEAFTQFRAQYEGHHEQLILIPQTIVHLDATMKRLDRTIETVGEQVGALREDVAELKARG